ncbi:ssDNA endonuclease and repair protein rad10 [Thelotrema lepadinum]|nr:ssDNA endonuclease and repair protein rad10 [Thelotrema lepadinum]
MDDDDFTADADFLALANAVEKNVPSRPNPAPKPTANTPSAPQNAAPPKVTQPTPQAIARPSGPSAILVSPRQKGNPVLNHIKGVPWEYSDTIADYVLGATTCALFLSLKYHRLHPEYVYQRIRQLAGKFNLRVLLTMVDIDNHEEPLRELAKTSLVNNLTLILAWSAREAARYIEAYKALEHAAPTGIRGQQAMSYAERMVEFVTVPRGINKTDAVGLVSAFGSVRAAVNARKEEISGIQGWGEVKVKRWHESVREPFRIQKTAKKQGAGLKRGESDVVPIGAVPTGISREVTQEEPARRERDEDMLNEDEEEMSRLADVGEQMPSERPSIESSSKKPRYQEPELSDSMKAALAKYRS